MLAKRKGLSRMDFCWCECDRGQWRHRVRSTTVLQLGSQAGTSNFREVPYATWLAISRRELFPIPFFFIPCVTMHPPPPDSSSDIGRYLCRPYFDIHFVAGRLKPLYRSTGKPSAARVVQERTSYMANCGPLDIQRHLL
jgi:hypothetical protein